VRASQTIKEGDRVIGRNTKIKVVKNKVAAPFREAEPDMIYGRGFDQNRDLLRVATLKNVLEKSGTWLSYKGERLGQGITSAEETLALNPELASKIMAQVRDILIPKEE
jgi:recombination protein RecA